MLSIASTVTKVALNEEAKERSLINSKKSNGPKMDFCEIPIFTKQCVELTLFTVVHCLRSVRYLFNNFKRFY